MLALVACGLTQGEIAERLMVSQRTVERHRARCLAELDSRTHAQAVGRARELCLLAPSVGLGPAQPIGPLDQRRRS